MVNVATISLMQYIMYCLADMYMYGILYMPTSTMRHFHCMHINIFNVYMHCLYNAYIH